jgi:integrase
LPYGERVREYTYSPHSIRATRATLLLDSSVSIESVQDLLDHNTSPQRRFLPMHVLLAEFMRAWQAQTLCPQPQDWVFPSLKLRGKKPRAANMLVEDYLRPAAVKAQVIAEGDPCRFGFHNLRHSLASFLVRSKTDPKTVQALLRHSDVKTTLQLYAHSVSTDRMTAQGEVRHAILGSRPAGCGLSAD